MNFGIRVEQNEVVFGPQSSRAIAAFDEAQILIILEERNARVALKTPQNSAIAGSGEQSLITITSPCNRFAKRQRLKTRPDLGEAGTPDNNVDHRVEAAET